MYERLFFLQEEVLKSLANHKRLEILQLLNNQELTVNQMVAMLGISQANVSQHLSNLRRLKLVTPRKDGLYVYYRLSDKRIASVIHELREFLKSQYSHEPEIARIAALDSNALYPIVRDPVCGMRISVNEAGETLIQADSHYYFCAQGCKDAFLLAHGTLNAPKSVA
ncbi:MAG: metalloregulator ArsR/SmtB family transcription factor [Candidatus Saccharibacteria bacterium]